jgi:MFS family permease
MTAPAEPTPLSPRAQRILAAVAIMPILATVYQTLVLTDVTDDVIRKGIEGDSYQMIWTNLSWGLATLYGIFAGLWAMVRFGSRDTLCVGLVLFAAGNVLCGLAVDIPTMAAARVVEGLGKGLTIVLCRAMLYRQFNRAVLTAIGFYGVVAYATRPATPLMTALINDWLDWRWIYWVNVPVTLLGLVLVRRFIRPDRPAKPLPLRIDWLAVTLFAAWVTCILFAFGWYRKWGGWSSNAFAATVLLALLLPVVLLVRLTGGSSPDEHLQRIVRVRVYVLAMCLRLLLLLNLGVVLTLVSKYMVALRDYPREVAGWVLASATGTMALSTILTVRFHRRKLRHVWLLIGVVGSSVVLWLLGNVDNFTRKEHLALLLACWGLFVGLLPPVFLTDEVEWLDRRDALYGGAIAVVCLVLPLIIVPTMASTVVSVWTDRALDAERQNLQAGRPVVQTSAAQVADYYRQRGVLAPQATQMSYTVLGAFAKTESAAHGIESGLRFLSLATGAIGLLVTALLFASPAGRGVIPAQPVDAGS